MDKFIVMVKQIQCFSHQYSWRVEDYMYCYYSSWGMHDIENNRLIVRV